jgi:hypothetical protein
MIYPEKFVLFAGADVEDAKHYISENKLTSDDVKIMKNDSGVYVVCKKQVKLS